MCYNMKTTFPIMSFFIIWTACRSNSGPSEQINVTIDSIKTPAQTGKQEKTQVNSECDSLKFPDFKVNIQEQEIKITLAFKTEIDKIANAFIKKQCEQDTLYCDDIYLKDRKHYRSSLGYDLFSFGYSFKNSETGMEKESASFFVFGIKQNGKTIFYDITDDLIGEIQLKLSGFEIVDKKTIIWGEMYPYFSSDDYGKFKLTIDGKESTYEFQCKSQGH